MFKSLNYPPFEYRIRPVARGYEIWDNLRKKYVKLTPEEWVRQHVINYLITEKQYPAGRLALEMQHKYLQQGRRTDLIAFNATMQPCLLVECKAPEIILNNKVIEQSALYNTQIKSPFTLITNGLSHYCFQTDYMQKKSWYIDEIPDYAKATAIFDVDLLTEE